jgi:hypothetical protein
MKAGRGLFPSGAPKSRVKAHADSDAVAVKEARAGGYLYMRIVLMHSGNHGQRRNRGKSYSAGR